VAVTGWKVQGVGRLLRGWSGSDTHADIHIAVALDHLGGMLGAIEIPTTRAGLFRWLWAHWAAEGSP